MRHLRDAACIVRDGAEGIDRHDDARHREHRDRRHRHAVQPRPPHAAGDIIAAKDRRPDHDHRPRGRLHADCETRDNVRGMSRFAGLRDLLHRQKALGGVVVGDEHEGERYCQAHERAGVILTAAHAADAVH